MRKGLWIIGSSLICLIGLTGFALFISIDLKMLEPEEQERFRKGKEFWEWNSPHGPLAMHYIEKGEGNQHLLLLHGFRSHSYTWNEIISPLASAGYHVWAIDLIGYGLSDKPEHANYHIDLFLQQIHDFMQEKKLNQVHLVGSSMGGGLALTIAVNYPDFIRSLTLLSALGYPLEMPFYLSFAKHFHQMWIPFLGPKTVRQSLKKIVYNPDLITDERVEAYSLPYRLPGGVKASIKTLQKYDNQHLVKIRKQYSLITCPILIIWGDNDRLIPIHHYEKFLSDFPHADTLLINECGHIPQEEHPQEVLSAILPFLDKLDKTK